MSGISTGGLPPINEAALPASIRNGDSNVKNAYRTALAFEQLLVQQLSSALTSSVSGSDGSSSDGTSSDGSSSGGLMGSDPASSMYSQLLPSALSDGIMAGGGLGIAQQLVTALDPSLTAAAQSGTTSSAGTTSSTTSNGGASPAGGSQGV